MFSGHGLPPPRSCCPRCLQVLGPKQATVDLVRACVDDDKLALVAAELYGNPNAMARRERTPRRTGIRLLLEGNSISDRSAGVLARLLAVNVLDVLVYADFGTLTFSMDHPVPHPQP